MENIPEVRRHKTPDFLLHLVLHAEYGSGIFASPVLSFQLKKAQTTTEYFDDCLAASLNFQLVQIHKRFRPFRAPLRFQQY